MAKRAKVSSSNVSYTVDYRDIKYPRLEFKTGKLLLVVPKQARNESELLEKHAKWINNRSLFIRNAIVEAKDRKLDLKRTDNEFRSMIQLFVNHACTEFGVNINSVRFRKMKSKWGSCSSSKNLTFNTMLRFLPESFIEYVVFHETAHLLERKHNDKFWKLLKSGYGDYGDKEKGLFAYWFLVQEQLN